MHIRTKIRHAVVEMLTGLGSTGTRVETNRATPVALAAGQSLAVRVPGETAQEISQGGTQERVIRVRCDVTGKGATEPELADALDASAEEIERAWAGNPTLGGFAEATQYRGCELALSGEGQQITGTLSLAFEVSLYTSFDAPDRNI